MGLSRSFRYLVSVLALTEAVAVGGVLAAVPRGWHATILYTADERGEVTPCG